jgi:hypothetical protein
MRLYSLLAVPACALLVACGSSDDDDSGAKEPAALGALAGCRAYLTGTMRKLPFTVPAPQVSRTDGTPLPGTWTETATTHTFVSTDWVNVPCGAPTASLTFSNLVGVGRLSTRIHTEVPLSDGSKAELHLWPDPPVIDDPTLGSTVPLESYGGFPVTLVPSAAVPDICKSSQEVFPVGDVVLNARVGAPAGDYRQSLGETEYVWRSLEWKTTDAPFQLEDAEVSLVCDSDWSFGGGYQLTYENEVSGVVKAQAQHDFWIEGELALVDDTKVLGYVRLYDIEVKTSGNVTGSYSGPTDVLIAVEGHYEKNVDGKAYVDLPYLEASGVTWQYALDVLGTRITEQNANILQDHLDRLNLLLPPSPTRPGFFRVAARGQEDTFAGDRPEGFVIVNWGFYRRE